MSELVGCDLAEAGPGGGAGQLVAEHVFGDPAALVGEQEIGEPAGAGVRHGPAGGTVLHDPVDQFDGFGVQRHHPFSVQLAQRHLQPGPRAGDLVHAVQFQVDEFPDPHAGRPGQQQRVGAEPVARLAERGGQPPVGVRRVGSGATGAAAGGRRGGRPAAGRVPRPSPTR